MMKVGEGYFDICSDISCDVVTTTVSNTVAVCNDRRFSVFTSAMINQYLQQWIDEVYSTVALFKDKVITVCDFKDVVCTFLNALRLLSVFFSMTNSDFRGFDAYHLLRVYALSKLLLEINYCFRINEKLCSCFVAPIYNNFHRNDLLFEKWASVSKDYLFFLASRDRNGIGACMYDYAKLSGFYRPRVVFLISL